jgi:putative thiamine transport system ATP-binding protein
MPERGLTLERLCIEREARRLVELDVQVAPGETLTLMGPSGIGKSTVLAAVTGTLAPGFRLMGRVLLDGRDITALPTEARQVGILLQDELLFPHLSVGGNLAFGLPASVRRPERGPRVEAALAEVGLDGFGPRDPATLSGGQKARVALMRMLLSEPKALLLDEPFSRLDARLRDQTRRLVFDLASARGLPTLLVTHDAEDAAAAGGRVIELG